MLPQTCVTGAGRHAARRAGRTPARGEGRGLRPRPADRERGPEGLGARQEEIPALRGGTEALLDALPMQTGSRRRKPPGAGTSSSAALGVWAARPLSRPPVLRSWLAVGGWSIRVVLAC